MSLVAGMDQAAVEQQSCGIESADGSVLETVGPMPIVGYGGGLHRAVTGVGCVRVLQAT